MHAATLSHSGGSHKEPRAPGAVSRLEGMTTQPMSGIEFEVLEGEEVRAAVGEAAARPARAAG
jgi:hypothetical protein